MAGWIKLHRALCDKPIWLDSAPEQKTVLITLMLMANHAGNEWEWQGQLYKVKPGQFITSLPSIVKKCGKGISIQNVRTALKKFEKYGFLTDESTNQNRLITIVNWEVYQAQDIEDNRQTNRQLTDDQQTTNRQLTANKNVKNVKNENNDKKTTGSVAVNKNNEVHLFYQQNFPGTQSPYIAQDIDYWINDLSAELVIQALTKAVEAGKPYNYAKGIMRNWVDKGYKTIGDVNAEAETFQTSKKQPNTVVNSKETEELLELSRRRLEAAVANTTEEDFSMFR